MHNLRVDIDRKKMVNGSTIFQNNVNMPPCIILLELLKN